MFPPPPNEASGIPEGSAECDIIENAVYIAGYECTAPCQADQTLMATLFCNCHIKMGPLQFIKQCEWDYKDRGLK